MRECRERESEKRIWIEERRARQKENVTPRNVIFLSSYIAEKSSLNTGYCFILLFLSIFSDEERSKKLIF